MDKRILFKAFEKMSKKELITLLETAYINLEGNTQRYVFGDLYKELTKKERTPDKLLADIRKFYAQSMNGDYYASFMINSKIFQIFQKRQMNGLMR